MRVSVSVVGHSSAGKTSLVEALLHRAGAISRPGRVEDGNTQSDFSPLEQRRKMSVQASVLPLAWQGSELLLLDAPGFADFAGEIRGALRAADNTLVVVSAVAGVEVGTERVWATAEDFGMPRIIAVNKTDRERADFHTVLEELRSTLSGAIVATHLPRGEAAAFGGVVDVLSGRSSDGSALPIDLEELLETERARLVECVVETDEALLERFLADEVISEEELRAALLAAVRAGQVFPVLPVSAFSEVGVGELLDLMVSGLREAASRPPLTAVDGQTRDPDPTAPFSARVWRSSTDPFLGKVAYLRVWSGSLKPGQPVLNARRGVSFTPAHLYVMRGKDLVEVPELRAGDIAALTKLSEVGIGDTLCDPAHPLDYGPMKLPEPTSELALHPKSRADEDKLATQLARLLEDDLTLRFERRAETGEMVLAGLGDLHLEIATDKLALLGVNVETSLPKIPYRETVRGTARAQGKHKKQSGGHGQYGDCWLRVEPAQGFAFASEVVGGAIPSKFIPSIQKGVEESLARGVLAGFPVQDVRVVVYDGSYHEVDSSDIAFKTAAGIAFREAMAQAKPTLLEPVVQLRVYVPERCTGDVISDLQTRRARVQGIESSGPLSVITATVPLAEVQAYSPQLRSISSGRGAYSLKPAGYEEVPRNLQAGIIASRQLETA
ncbi:elongation factor G [Deinobacterium chartae]|uniref:Elongation factor G n=1 Tax=Deinobacterium chartae TaxID=521158 RepID=A0A841I1W7_9DEIO|nr:elongation factor G [Deinobacterium chartae]MBB6099811.1 elongation factor G [Deinobacterium chartae]